MKNTIIVVVALFLLAVGACKKDIAGIPPPDSFDSTHYNQIFQGFWQGMNNRYVFWSIDTIDWDRMYRVYQPKFNALTFGDPAASDSAHAYFTSMVSGLIDNHYNLSFHDTSFHPISPASLRKTQIQKSIPFSFFYDSIPKYYLDTWARGDSNFINNVADQEITTSTAVVTGLIQRHILYFHLSSFYLSLLLENLHPYYLTNAWNFFLSRLKNPTLGLKGLIIDLRSNSGGSLNDLNFIVGQIAPASGQFGFTRYKNGSGRLDYTPWAPALLTIDDNSAKFTGPIVVLTDQHSVSMSEQTTLVLKELANARIIGDTTWGATGPLSTAYELFEGGQFDFAHFGYVYTSSSMFKDNNGIIYESKGIPPDQFIRINADSIRAGRDTQLQAAINYINSK